MVSKTENPWTTFITKHLCRKRQEGVMGYLMEPRKENPSIVQKYSPESVAGQPENIH